MKEETKEDIKLVIILMGIIGLIASVGWLIWDGEKMERDCKEIEGSGKVRMIHGDTFCQYFSVTNEGELIESWIKLNQGEGKNNDGKN